MAIAPERTIEEPRDLENALSMEAPADVTDSGVAGLDEISGLDAFPAEELELLVQPEWQLAQRIVSSKGFRKSELLPRFLLYVCQERLCGRTFQITEQRIGTLIFQRPSDYNPGEDNIVRSYARLLRKRLDAYFENEGAEETMRIVIPRGGYVPTFLGNSEASALRASLTPTAMSPHDVDYHGLDAQDHPLNPEQYSLQRLRADSGQNAESSVPARPVAGYAVSAIAAAPQALQDPASIHARSGRFRNSWLPFPQAWFAGAAGVMVGLLLAWGIWWGAREFEISRQMGPAHLLWTQVFQTDRTTFLVPADSGLDILENLTGHQTNLEEYANGSYLADVQLPADLSAGKLNDFRRQRYTSVADLDITARLVKLPEVISDRTEIRYARSITADDIKNSNVILLGSKRTNPWVALFEDKLNFKLEFIPSADQSYVLNQNPVGTEAKIYRNSTGLTPGLTYGVIAYLPELNGRGHVLIIEGLNMAGTQAAADSIFSTNAIRPVLQQAKLADGSLRPFEVLIQATSMGAAAPAQIIATRVGTR